MAGGKRNSTFSLPASSLKQMSTETESKRSTSSMLKENNSSIHHIQLPDIPRCSVLLFEILMFIFSMITLYIQYLNIYRTVFWLPHSYTNTVMNYYLIEINILKFILNSMSRRVSWSIIKSLLTVFCPSNFLKSCLDIAKFILLAVFVSIFCYCVTAILQNVTLIQVLALAYPFFIYFFVFNMELIPFFEITPASLHSKEDPGYKHKTLTPRLLHHSCLNNNEGIRNEAEFFYNYCSKLFTRVVYETMVASYYTCLVPCFFVPNTLHYDTLWVAIHTVFVTVTYFMCYAIFCYPARFCENVYRNVEHLGGWSAVKSSSSLITPQVWSSNVIYSKGAVVKHGRELFRAEGSSNVAEPGNAVHYRLYFFFNKSWNLVFYVTAACFLSCLLYVCYMYTLKQWHQVMGTGFLILFNCLPLYCLIRDYVLLKAMHQHAN